MQIAFIDHYDSFSFNVLDWLRRASRDDMTIIRITSDDQTGLARVKKSPIPAVISPGPGRPEDYPRTMETISSIMDKVPILGICLGHQMLGKLAGGTVIRSRNPWHGTPSRIRLSEPSWLTHGVNDHFHATCYNSLIVQFNEHPAEWSFNAFNEDNELMMMTHRKLPVASVQFHPESFASEEGATLAGNFLRKLI